MSDAVPAAPLVPVEVDLRGLPFMPLDVVRLLDSDLFALTSGDEFKAALSLWCKAWLQVPAASLPNDDRVLAHLSGAGARWRKVKDMALRGWQLCSDDRLYHPVIAEKALAAWEERVAYRERRGNETERLRRHREEHKRLREQLRELGFTYPHNTSMETLRAALQDAELNIHRGVSSNAPVRVSGPSPETQPLRLREGQGQGQGEGQGEGYLKDPPLPPEGDAAGAASDRPRPKPRKSTTVTATTMTNSVTGLSQDVAEAYLVHRKAKRAPLTDLAWKGIAKTLLDAAQLGAAPDRVLSKAIERGWTGLELEWLINSGVLSSGHQGSPPHLNLDQIDHEEGLERQADGTYRIARP
ncbi:DUF1376 domain-containing protein [Pseudomonas aeruginosa]|uniref:DUF1376 domain-containing protein n=1 Tax=Pseudomonas aeruginosa TaxID=287 RepID=UPI0039FBD998